MLAIGGRRYQETRFPKVKLGPLRVGAPTHSSRSHQRRCGLESNIVRQPSQPYERQNSFINSGNMHNSSFRVTHCLGVLLKAVVLASNPLANPVHSTSKHSQNEAKHPSLSHTKCRQP